MFKKLLSNLPYNPSLIGQVSFYAKRIHSEEKLRRLGLGFVALAMFVQMFAFVSQPEPTLAESSNDIIRGGFQNRDQAVLHCINPNSDFSKILAYYGVDCDILARSSTISIRSNGEGGRYDSLGRNPQGSVIARTGKPTDEYRVNINGSNFYMKNLWAWDSGAYSTYKVLKMTNKHGQVIMIMYNCGNIVTIDKYSPPTPTPTPPTPTPITPGNASCVSLTATALSERSYRFKASTSGTDYTVKSYVFSFGDGTSKTVRTGLFSTSTEHTYNASRSYTVKVSIDVNVQGSSGPVAKTLQCQTSLTTNTPDACPDVIGTQATRSECDVCPAISGTQSNEAECKPCEAAADDQDGTACLILAKAARNNTQRIDNADGTVAKGNDSITYTLSVTNNGKIAVKDFVVEENVADILDYADITDFNGGKLEGVMVSWPKTTLSPNETIKRRLTVRVKNPIPQTPISVSDPARFDMVMNNVYGNAVNIKLAPNVLKTTEEITARTLPNTGPGESLAAAVTFTVFVSYFLARSRLFAKELDIVRTDYASSGGY